MRPNLKYTLRFLNFYLGTGYTSVFIEAKQETANLKDKNKNLFGEI